MGTAAPVPLGFAAWGIFSLPGLLFSSWLPPKRLWVKCLNRPKSVLGKPKVEVLLNPHLTSKRIENCSFVSLCPRQSSAITSPTGPSLSTINRVSGVSPFAGSLISCIRKFCSTHSRNLLESFLLHCIPSIHLLSWSLPQEQGLVMVRLLPAACKIFPLPPHPGWMVHNRLLPQYLSCYPSRWFLPINTQLFYHQINIYTVKTAPNTETHLVFAATWISNPCLWDSR